MAWADIERQHGVFAFFHRCSSSEKWYQIVPPISQGVNGLDTMEFELPLFVVGDDLDDYSLVARRRLLLRLKLALQPGWQRITPYLNQCKPKSYVTYEVSCNGNQSLVFCKKWTILPGQELLPGSPVLPQLLLPVPRRSCKEEFNF